MDFFDIKKNNISVSHEIFAGIMNFFASMYILILNPIVLSSAGMSPQGVFIATAIATFAATMIAGLYANIPIVLAPGLATQAYFVAIALQNDFHYAILATYCCGLLMLLLSKFSISAFLKRFITEKYLMVMMSGIGLALAAVGLGQCGISVEGTALSIQTAYSLIAVLAFFSINTSAPSRFRVVLLAFIFVALGAVDLWLGGIRIENPAELLLSNLSSFTSFPEVMIQFPEFKNFSLSAGGALAFIQIVAIMTYMHYLDTFFCISIAEFLTRGKGSDEKRVEKAVRADAVGVVISSVCGTAPTTAFAESCLGAMFGGKTGLTAVVTAFCFLFALFLQPVFSLVSVQVTSPFLIYAGLRMFVVGIRQYYKAAESVLALIPACLLIVYIGMTFALANGFLMILLWRALSVTIGNGLRRVNG